MSIDSSKIDIFRCADCSCDLNSDACHKCEVFPYALSMCYIFLRLGVGFFRSVSKVDKSEVEQNESM
ncbi:MAG: hypothetical protein HDR03_12290 [Lachnospiraceae bacterium]|nr:hypothetical protein [Lachnospiraceae bacterium]